MELIFEGDWTSAQAQQIAGVLRKFGVGDGLGVPDELIPPSIAGSDVTTYLTRKQKDLLKMLQDGVSTAIATEDDDQPIEWGTYGRSPLEKALSMGAVKIASGVRYRLNSSRRWEKIGEDSSGLTDAPANINTWDFPMSDGPFGRGIYFPVLSAPMGGPRIRIDLGITPDELVSDERFYELEADLSQDTPYVLRVHGIKAVAESEGDRVTLLYVSDPGEITPLGVISDGRAVSGAVDYQLVDLVQQGDRLVADIEVVSVEFEALQKSAKISTRRTMHSDSALDGTPISITTAPQLDRSLVRQACDRCRLDGVPLDRVQVRLVPGAPNFLPKMTRAYCLPSDGAVCLCPHDPAAAVRSLVGELGDRLKAFQIDPDRALDVLVTAAKLSPDWWLEMLIKRYTGAVLAHGVRLPEQYYVMLGGRGYAYWGTPKLLTECIAEDFRVALDPSGLPNLVTLEWDLLVPAHARAMQQLCLSFLTHANPE